MKIPNKLKIGSHIFTIDMTQELGNKDGETIYKNHTIRICKTIPQSRKESTFIHEIFHAINSTIADTDIGHILQDSLSEQLYQVLKDNNLLHE